MRYICELCKKEFMQMKCAPDHYPRTPYDFCTTCSKNNEWVEEFERQQMLTYDGGFWALDAAKQLGIYTEELKEKAAELLKEDIDMVLNYYKDDDE